MISLSRQDARRLAVNAQLLAGPRPPATEAGLLKVAKTLRCIQIDAVAVTGVPTQLLVPFSRLGPFDQRLLDRLLFEKRLLFHYFAHAASIVLTEDFPIHSAWMRPYQSREDSWGARIASWMSENSDLRDRVLGEIATRGPLRSRDFEQTARRDWQSSGWTMGRNVNRMLEFLWVEGRLTVAGRAGQERLWDLSERWFPESTPRDGLETEERWDLIVEHALRALGVATARDLRGHFVRRANPDLPGSLRRLLDAGRAETVAVEGSNATWYVHRDRLPLLEVAWRPRTVLLSPFDNLICDRRRTADLFGFEYTIEIYVPPAKRRRGYYAMPILAGDRLIGTADVRLDRSRKTLVINSLQLEPGFRMTSGVVSAVESLATFVGASAVEGLPD